MKELSSTGWAFGSAAVPFAVVLLALACSERIEIEPFDRSLAPALSDPGNLTLPPVVRKELENGLGLLLVEHHELPVVNLIMVVKAGPELDPADKLGLGTLTAALLDEGTEGRDALAIADQVAFLGARLATGGSWDASRIVLETMTAQLDSALRLFADVVLRPSFPAGELERLRRERLTAILQIADSPPQLAELAIAKVVFGDDNPYGRTQLGTERTVKAIERSDVLGFWRRNYRPNNSTLIAVGDFKPAELESRLAELFGSWERAAVDTPQFSTPPKRSATSIYLVDKPGAPQSSVRIGQVGVARSSPDYFGLVAANTVLGGSFTSRLNMNLRENKAYTYGAGSRFDMRRSEGPFTARAEVFASKTDSAVLEFMKELTAIRDTIPVEELAKSRQYLQLQLPGAFETTGDIANQLVPVALYGLPLDYYNKYAQNIGAVSQADAQRVMQAHLDPGKLAVVVVGDRRVIEPGLRRLGLGTPQLVQVERE
jgi:predicted Zn-dependent peptidase